MTTRSLSPDGIPSEAIKKFHERMFEKASQAIYLQPVSERDFFSFIMAIESEKTPEMKKDIRSFISKMDEKYGNSKNADRVVNLGTHLFGLSK